MRKAVIVILVSFLLATLAFVHKGNVPAVEANLPIYQGDLVLNGNNVTTIEGRFDINGSIIVEENATLILNNATLNFTYGFGNSIFLQNPFNGNPRLKAKDSTIIGIQTSRNYGNSSLTFSNCSVDGSLHFYDETNVTIIDSQMIETLTCRDSSRVYISNSTIERLDLITKSANSSINNLTPKFFDSWNFWSNCSIVAGIGGMAPNATLMQTTVQKWGLSFQSSSYSEVTSSDIWHLHANQFAHISAINSTVYSIELYGFSVVELTNSTRVTSSLHNEAKICFSWYLDTHVVDSIDQDVPSANVTAHYPNATLADLKLTDVDGWARLTLLEKMMNVSGEYPIGNYTVEATYETYSNSTSVNMAGNQQITLTLEDFVIPEFPAILILPLFMIATLLAVIVYRRKTVSDCTG